MKVLLTLLLFVFAIFIGFPVYSYDSGNYHIEALIEKNTISSDVVVYNLSNGKLHLHDCEWAEKCTKNCIYIPQKRVKKMFFVPCMSCGGGVIEPMDEWE